MSVDEWRGEGVLSTVLYCTVLYQRRPYFYLAPLKFLSLCLNVSVVKAVSERH